MKNVKKKKPYRNTASSGNYSFFYEVRAIMNIVEIIIAIPMISVSEKLLESQTAEITHAETGSMLEMMLALVGPISRMPSRKKA